MIPSDRGKIRISACAPGVRGSEAYVAGPQSGWTADTNASWIVLDCDERRRNAWLRDIEGTHLDMVIGGRVARLTAPACSSS